MTVEGRLHIEARLRASAGRNVRPAHCRHLDQIGFTLIEMSIVLVIIGLIVGGVLTGRDLIRAAEVRAQISQIEGYNTAVNTFRVKYNALPGDMGAADAATFGFTPRGQYAGEGDGNGLLEGNTLNTASGNNCAYEGTGETTLFWVDLTTANGLNVNLIAGGFSAADATSQPPTSSGSMVSKYLPQAAIGRGNYIYVWSCAPGPAFGTVDNYFGISAVSTIFYSAGMASQPSLSVQQAHSMDKKVDDGMPQSGNVTAVYNNAGLWFAAGGAWWGNTPGTSATSPSTSTCFDNGGVGGATQHYSLEVNDGAGANCALSFRFQ